MTLPTPTALRTTSTGTSCRRRPNPPHPPRPYCASRVWHAICRQPDTHCTRRPVSASFCCTFHCATRFLYSMCPNLPTEQVQFAIKSWLTILSSYIPIYCDVRIFSRLHVILDYFSKYCPIVNSFCTDQNHYRIFDRSLVSK